MRRAVFFERFERQPHLDRVLDRREHLRFERLGPLIPEEPSTRVIPCVRQAHGMPPSRPSVEPDAEPAWIREPVTLSVARRARYRIVGRQPGVVEQRAPQRGAVVGSRVVVRSVVGRRDAVGSVGGEVSRQREVGVGVLVGCVRQRTRLTLQCRRGPSISSVRRHPPGTPVLLARVESCGGFRDGGACVCGSAVDSSSAFRNHHGASRIP